MNRSILLAALVASLAGVAFSGEPNPSSRTAARAAVGTSVRPSNHATAQQARQPGTSPKVIGAGVKQSATNASNEQAVRQASASSPTRVVKANAQVVDEGIVYESQMPMASGEYIVDGGVTGDSSCASCGTGGCDGSCGESCGASCGWGDCGFDLCSPGPGRRRQLCICLPSHGWAQMDYLMWWQEGMYVPALLTTSPNGTAQANAGVLNLPTTSILLGDEDLLQDRLNGGRIRFGWWFANCPKLGIEAEYFGTSTLRYDETNQSTGNPILARPFFNIAPETGFAREDSELVAFPNVVSGSFNVNAFSTLDGAAVRFRRMLCCGTSCSYAPLCCGPVPTQSRIDATLGWRFLQLREGLTMTEDLDSLVTTEPGSFLIQDNFRTRNQFNGVELGFLWSTRRGYWSLDGLMRCSFGNVRQEVTINGSTAITQSGATTNHAGGFLAQSTNSGVFTREQFAVVPEFGATLGYSLTPRWRLTAGYTFIYWSNVVRPGDQIDTDVNPNLLAPAVNPLVGAARPRFEFRNSDYWVQGVNLGAEYRW